MSVLKRNLFLVIGLLLLVACHSSGENNVNYQTKFVKGSTDNKIEVLDFGGSGTPILMLTGMGNSAHVYVDFAPKFKNDFQVYAMTRRGYGASELTPNGFSVDTLAQDILAVLKALDLNKVVLIGHSIAGDEISKFASTYPDKVEKVVYLDAAYDRTGVQELLMPYYPSYPEMTAKDSSSLKKVNAYVKKIVGVLLPDEEIESTSVFSPDGKYLADITPDETQGKIMLGLEHPNYRHIECPALAIYATPTSIYDIIPFYDQLSAADKEKADTLFVHTKEWDKQQMERFKKDVDQGIVKEIEGANHYVFISHPAETEKMIRDFLK